MDETMHGDPVARIRRAIGRRHKGSPPSFEAELEHGAETVRVTVRAELADEQQAVAVVDAASREVCHQQGVTADGATWAPGAPTVYVMRGAGNMGRHYRAEVDVDDGVVTLNVRAVFEDVATAVQIADVTSMAVLRALGHELPEEVTE